MSEEKFCIFLNENKKSNAKYRPKNICKIELNGSTVCPICGRSLYKSSNVVEKIDLSDVNLGPNKNLQNENEEVVSTGMACMTCMLYFEDKEV